MTDDQIKRTWLLETGVEESRVPFAVLDFARAVERQALERAAHVAESIGSTVPCSDGWGTRVVGTSIDAAKAIRALIDAQSSEDQK
jgi:hypothetical protein